MQRRVMLAAVAVLLSLSACARQDLRDAPANELRPLGDGRYLAKMIADAVYPDGSAAAEADRLRVLGEWMRDNGYCPQGWQIVSREAVLRSKALLGEIKDVYYTIECKAGEAS